MFGKKKVLGVIGGLGPIATARFLELTAQMTNAKRDQDHLDMIVYNFPDIPDRTGYILGSNLRSPLPGLLSVGRALSRRNVHCIAIPSITAHYFHSELSSAIPTPIINVIEETVLCLKESGITCAGIMATEGTVVSGLFSKAMENAGIIPVLPTPPRQADVNHLIYRNIKAGNPPDMDRFRTVRDELRDGGSQAIILGCGELSLIRRDCDIGPGFLDTMEVLARRSILLCGKELKEEYRSLLPKR